MEEKTAYWVKYYTAINRVKLNLYQRWEMKGISMDRQMAFYLSLCGRHRNVLDALAARVIDGH